MKYILLFFFCLFLIHGKAQKYALLDKRLAQPITYTNHITTADSRNGLLPVEKKSMPQFIKALEEISATLSSPKLPGVTKQYEIGCTKFKGFSVSLASGGRLDYMIISTCEDIKISMHLSDAKISNANNAYFISTWLKYIKSSYK